jgi:crotonobetainyl-CoA:carnitine CoA-transferase CaiB-like acyl-CoA transferase
MLDDPQYRARQSIVDVPHPAFDNLKMQNVFPRMSATQGSVRWPGPGLGEHNDEIYGKLLGLSDKQRKELGEAGII